MRRQKKHLVLSKQTRVLLTCTLVLALCQLLSVRPLKGERGGLSETGLQGQCLSPLPPHPHVRLSVGRCVLCLSKGKPEHQLIPRFPTLNPILRENHSSQLCVNFLEVKRTTRFSVSPSTLQVQLSSRNICEPVLIEPFSECRPRVGWARAWQNGI